MPKCNSVLQTENDLFQPEIRPFFRLQNPQKLLGICQLIKHSIRVESKSGEFCPFACACFF